MTGYKTPLQRILKEEGRRQSWLAEKIGKQQSQVSMIVNGFIPDDATQAAIADALGRQIDELFPNTSVPAEQAA